MTATNCPEARLAAVKTERDRLHTIEQTAKAWAEWLVDHTPSAPFPALFVAQSILAGKEPSP